MGEVVVSSEEMRTESEKQRSTEMKNNGGGGGDSSSGVVMRWEKLLPGMNMRVLLVEADDSTRHIIAALLRKCSYRVAAVPDGLKAWEILKARSDKIDLILMEVDLPSISGFALLTLIMEHEICKNIPVIMMSSQDSINTVYKCMTRGVSDYLVKPIRKNELRNLWQHVWRRQALARNIPQDESVGQEKIEGTSDNDAASNHSSGYVACAQRNKEDIEKGTDSQSSCTRPDFEAESAPVDMQEFSQQIQAKNFLDDLRMQKDEGNTNCSEKLLMHENESRGPAVNAYKGKLAAPLGEVAKQGSHRRDANMDSEACDDNDLLVNSSRNVTDFFGVCSSYPISNLRNSSSSNRPSTYDSTPPLDLSLRRSDSSGIETQVTEKRHTLGHSNASAFSRYINRPLQPQNPLTGINDQQKAYQTTSEKPASPVNMDCDTPAATSSIPRSVITVATGQSNQSEIGTSCPQQRLFPLPVPIKGVRFNNLCNGYGTVLPPTFCTQSSPSPMPSSAAQQEPSFLMSTFYPTNLQNHKPEHVYDPAYHNSKVAMEQTMQQQEQRFDEDRGHISSNNDQSATSSFCNGNASHLNSLGYGSACGSNNVDQVAMFRAAPESKNEDSVFNHSGNNRSIQREAALNKFRLKRKDRCYEKKVRYESRKKLAEQRPRIKGQFVRQVLNDPSHMEAEGNAYED
ncbi:putative response regulator and transcription factor RR-A-type family [Rosa chinensis]|uniref:Putative response regulator and transcription factor RR-A-type family n=2 Tax=Rosa chinensis TaxID=74649 RepID=A0A2P6SPH9_ROSCH|nr:two-component response regulator-like APRR5 isoform X1 [Rosa chinensis]PRQ60581.1 putative response regulator and transcription factor RR-A-type family [Rosa chinensis]